jgi:hypothetical protein
MCFFGKKKHVAVSWLYMLRYNVHVYWIYAPNLQV